MANKEQATACGERNGLKFNLMHKGKCLVGTTTTYEQAVEMRSRLKAEHKDWGTIVIKEVEL